MIQHSPGIEKSLKRAERRRKKEEVMSLRDSSRQKASTEFKVVFTEKARKDLSDLT